MTDERRNAPRQKTLLAGKVVYGANRFAADCAVRDLSAGGARLSFAEPAEIPNEFELHLPSRGTAFRAEVRWRRGPQIGVKFRAVLRRPFAERERLAQAG
jgi:PilZ domain